MGASITVKAAYDAEAAVWYVEESDVAGLSAEADTLEALVRRLPAMILDLIEDGADPGIPLPADGGDLPLTVIARADATIRFPSAA